MSTDKADAGAFLRWIIASEYYDGAIAGIGERATDCAAVWFRVVAWDEAQWRRVFAVATVEASLSKRLIQNLAKVEPRKAPFWLPGTSSATPEIKKDWDEIADAAARSATWRLVEAHDLNERSVERSVMPGDVPRVLGSIRAGSVLAVSGPSLTNRFLEQIRLQAG
jgi:hypothetical protein